MTIDATPASAPASESEAYVEHLWKRRCSTTYRIRLSVLYHLKRERFFDRFDKSMSVLTAVAATAAVGVLLQPTSTTGPRWDLYTAALTAIASVLQLVIGPSLLARRHGQAASDFRRLLAACEAAGERWSEAVCDKFASQVIELEASEPAPLSALMADCQNQLSIASGDTGSQLRLTWYERLFMHFLDFDAAAIAARSAR
jgi:hypothetical protein